MGTETNKDERNTPEYLAQLLKDKKQIQAFPNVFVHLEKLLDEGKLDKLSVSQLQNPHFGYQKLYLPLKIHFS